MTETKTQRALWAARLHLGTGKPATLLSTETIREICEEYVAEVARHEALFVAMWDGTHDAFCAGDCGRLTANGFCRDCMVHGGVNAYDRLELAKGFLKAADERCREEVLKEREACRQLCATEWARATEPGTARDCHDAIKARSP